MAWPVYHNQGQGWPSIQRPLSYIFWLLCLQSTVLFVVHLHLGNQSFAHKHGIFSDLSSGWFVLCRDIWEVEEDSKAGGKGGKSYRSPNRKFGFCKPRVASWSPRSLMKKQKSLKFGFLKPGLNVFQSIKGQGFLTKAELTECISFQTIFWTKFHLCS